jgi:hypothetical protein
VIAFGAPRTVTELIVRPQQLGCRFADGSGVDLPTFLGRSIRRGDALRLLADGSDVALIERPSPRSQPQYLLYATIGYLAQPKESEKGAGFFVRAELPKSADGLSAAIG